MCHKRKYEELKSHECASGSGGFSDDGDGPVHKKPAGARKTEKKGTKSDRGRCQYCKKVAKPIFYRDEDEADRACLECLRARTCNFCKQTFEDPVWTTAGPSDWYSCSACFDEGIP